MVEPVHSEVPAVRIAAVTKAAVAMTNATDDPVSRVLFLFHVLFPYLSPVLVLFPQNSRGLDHTHLPVRLVRHPPKSCQSDWKKPRLTLSSYWLRLEAQVPLDSDGVSQPLDQR